MKRKNDVRGALEYVEKSLAAIKKDYDKSLEQKEICYNLRMQVKNVMENLRSALDYMALDTHESFPNQKNTKDKIYFPYGKDQAAFEFRVKKCFPELKATAPDIYLSFENMQPHMQGNTWLYDFCRLTNDNKHDSLTPQTRTSQKTYSIGHAGNNILSGPAGAIEAEPGAICINEIPITFDPKTGIPQQTPGLDIEVITWISFMFQGTKIEVYPFLLVVFRKINDFSKELYDKIEKINSSCSHP